MAENEVDGGLKWENKEQWLKGDGAVPTMVCQRG
jgi:hypothetical protein